MSETHVPAAMRRQVRERAVNQCKYCLFPEEVAFAPHWIDHITAEKHGGQTELDNLALACVLCNQHKGSDLTSIDPATGEIVPLFHPRRDAWSAHFQLSGGRIEALTAIGRVTVRLLQFNAVERVQERALLQAAGLLDLPRGQG